MKRENEAVVNRFLLSTLYIIIGEFLLFFMYKGSCSSMAISMPNILYTLMVISVIGIAVCAFFMIKGKKSALYYAVLCLIVLIIALFLKFYYVINIQAYLNVVFFVSKRYAIAGVFALLFYVYEIVYYFVNVGKPQK